MEMFVAETDFLQSYCKQLYMNNRRQQKVLELGSTVFPIPCCTGESHVSHCFQAKALGLNWLLLNTCGPT